MLDADTIHALQYQRRRRVHALAQVPPDRKEAELCMQRVDGILDRQRTSIAVASDGEIVYGNGGSWAAQQASWVTNASGAEEPVQRPDGDDGLVLA